MKNKLLSAFSLITLVCAIIWATAIIFFQPAGAAFLAPTAQSEQEMEQVETETSQVEQLSMPEDASQPLTEVVNETVMTKPEQDRVETEVSGVEILDEPVQVDVGEAVLAQVQLLREKYEQQIYTELPNWLVLTAERFVPNSNVTLPSGKPLPDYYTTESWFNLSRDKFVVEGVMRSISVEGELLRQNYWGPGINSFIEGAELVRLDYGGVETIQAGLEFGSEVRGWIDEGAKQYVVTVTDLYASSVQFAGQNESSNALQATFIYDLESGQLIQTEAVHHFSNGETKVANSLTFLSAKLVELADVPTEVQQALPHK